MKKRCLTVVLSIFFLLFLLGCEGENGSSAKLPLESDPIGRNYLDVVREFEDAGFYNIVTREKEIEAESIFAQFSEDGEVENLFIGGKAYYSADATYSKDVEIIVEYCTIVSNSTFTSITEEAEPLVVTTQMLLQDFTSDDTTSGDSSPSVDYVLNKNTMVFHYPGCKSVSDMKEKNKEYFYGSREEAIEIGYKSCGNCHP